MSYDIDYMDDSVPFSTLEGQTLTRIKNNTANNTVFFETADGRHFLMGHVQDCCETVYLEEVHGDLDDLVGSPILLAEELSDTKWDDVGYDRTTWTFYKLATHNGHVTLRWCGTSNGYYSEAVYLYEKDRK